MILEDDFKNDQLAIVFYTLTGEYHDGDDAAIFSSKMLADDVE